MKIIKPSVKLEAITQIVEPGVIGEGDNVERIIGKAYNDNSNNNNIIIFSI